MKRKTKNFASGITCCTNVTCYTKLLNDKEIARDTVGHHESVKKIPDEKDSKESHCQWLSFLIGSVSRKWFEAMRM